MPASLLLLLLGVGRDGRVLWRVVVAAKGSTYSFVRRVGIVVVNIVVVIVVASANQAAAATATTTAVNGKSAATVAG